MFRYFQHAEVIPHFFVIIVHREARNSHRNLLAVVLKNYKEIFVATLIILIIVVFGYFKFADFGRFPCKQMQSVAKNNLIKIVLAQNEHKKRSGVFAKNVSELSIDLDSFIWDPPKWKRALRLEDSLKIEEAYIYTIKFPAPDKFTAVAQLQKKNPACLSGLDAREFNQGFNETVLSDCCRE